MGHTRLNFFCDNAAMVEVIICRRAKDPCMLALLRYLMLISLRSDLMVHATHLLGKVNVLADHLSRSQAMQEFLSMHQLSMRPIHLPKDVCVALFL